MRPVSRAVLAREAAARNAAANMPDAACLGRADRWNELEAQYRRTPRSDGVRKVLEQTRREFCHACPALQGCAEWAQIEAYTGLAAGTAYLNGERQDARWLAPPPEQVAS